ncbi:Putative mycotoxin biosynthesis protein UstYa [Colletotrichum destructivum]|uniref:Mycotoxin biosynthesis protein UstYa n=1 Tax=Colletotrichum destructivum TaxID=34406 RepID=A0AAX4IU72_9PEZI|nr:Putative mycotoxin biosynthesis protein UstYa [Colletotrichum destructivum]
MAFLKLFSKPVDCGSSAMKLEKEPFISSMTEENIVCNAIDPRLKRFLHLSLVFNLIAACGIFWSSTGKLSKKPVFPDVVYSPVLDVLQYENVVFTTGFDGGRTAYMGPPTLEREALWNDLYGFGTSMINRDQAAQLVNKTVPVADETGNYDGTYVVMLGVFHQLHCVNLLRKSLYKDKPWSTDPDDPMSLMHLEHCIDALRQAVMCSVDITPHPWTWKDSENKEVADVMHTCRNFDAIREWARTRNVFERGWNQSMRVPDPLQS